MADQPSVRQSAAERPGAVSHGSSRAVLRTTTDQVEADASPADQGAADSPDSWGPRRALDQLSILHEAVRFIDEHGVQNLTMRRLGSRLGVEAMALYRYIPGREQLLDGVVEVVMDELYSDTMRPADQSATWTEYLQRMAHGVRTLALTHPQVFPLVATRPPAAPWLRPPLRSLRWVEGFMEGLVHHGFNGRTSVTVYRAFSTFLLGHLLLETSTLGGEMGLSEEEDTEFIESNNLDNYPMVTKFSAALSANAYQDEFEESLEDLLDRLAPLHHHG
ncbi:MAG TPA: TetR/AcrR family transcriptional regulator C-terminal domain-containing protein [Propionibacteriaceae bacterium]|nr:TetR/AcrR family transcriptional regulator C-terminal domain-containing protein [Propionibacteriaceae bacterium]